MVRNSGENGVTETKTRPHALALGGHLRNQVDDVVVYPSGVPRLENKELSVSPSITLCVIPAVLA